ncbi:hypothetical protein ERX35_003955 [Macrococcus equipercicus]|uniref:Uncharacterized protein n=1 Tax=Macrococcus equipercicus TaxID=69967 RepID=A0ABQ6RA56_9STAP|nr:hypothetical protein [Macrococcus equipercicus]KAA1040153.1 hypothetical protein ERX35_003955 [Macrococcus equipercicus]
MGTADQVFLAARYYDVQSLAQRIKDKIRPENHFTSIMAGISIHQIKTMLNTANPVARLMPNTNDRLQHSMTGITFSESFAERHKAENSALEVAEDMQQVTACRKGSNAARNYPNK